MNRVDAMGVPLEPEGQPLRSAISRKVRSGRMAQSPLVQARQRLVALAILFAGAFCVVAIRLAEVSLLAGGSLPPQAETEAPTRAEEPAPAPVRGEILDRNGVVLAATVRVPSLFADPRLVDDPERLAGLLAGILPGLDREATRRRLANQGRAFVWLHRHMTPAEALRVHRLGEPALGLRDESRRVYPQGRLLAHAVGYSSMDGHGLAGVERQRNERLAAGESVGLSIDSRVQHVVRTNLGAAVQRFEAKAAAGIVLDARSGEVLAMSSLPDFDPNVSVVADDPTLFDRASRGVYEMGSTFKTFTVAAALDSGVADMQSRYDATGPIQVASHTIHDYRPEARWLSVPEVLVHSSNIAAVRIGQAVGGARLRTYLGDLGLLNEIVSPAFRSASPLLPRKWGPVEAATVSFGQGISVSPVQLAAGFAAVVNGGMYRTPVLLREMAWSEARPVLAPETSARMRGLLRLVVLEGSGRKAGGDGYRLGGKTGTAQKVVAGRYDDTARIATFVGAFPIEAPLYVVAVILDDPKAAEGTQGFATAGWNSAPTAGAIVEGIAPLLDVVPARPAPDGEPSAPGLPAGFAQVVWN